IRYVLSNWINESLRPDTIVTATLKQRIRTNNGMWINGSEDIYSHVYAQFIHRLSRELAPKAWKRCKKKKLVPNAASLEGNGRGHKISERPGRTLAFIKAIQPNEKQVNWHLHMSFRCPAHMTQDDFQAKVRSVWMQSPWAMPIFEIEPREADWVGYSLK